MGFSTINHLFWDTPIYGNLQGSSTPILVGIAHESERTHPRCRTWLSLGPYWCDPAAADRHLYIYIYMTFWHYFDHGQTMDIRMTMVRRWWWWCRPQFLVGINHQSGCEVRIWIHWFFGGWMWLVVLPHSFWRFLGTDMCICQIQSGQWSYQHLAKRRRHLVPSCAQLCPVVQAFQQLCQPWGTSISNGWSSAWSTSPGHSWVLIRVDAASGPSCDVVSFFPEIFSWNILE